MSDARQIRTDLVQSARLDLLGPVDDHELLFDYRVRDRYLVGMLATDGTIATDPAQVDDQSPDADQSAPEAHDEGTIQEPGKAMLFPSSLGMSFAVEPGADTILALATWGEYRRVDNPIPPDDRRGVAAGRQVQPMLAAIAPRAPRHPSPSLTETSSRSISTRPTELCGSPAPVEPPQLASAS